MIAARLAFFLVIWGTVVLLLQELGRHIAGSRGYYTFSTLVIVLPIGTILYGAWLCSPDPEAACGNLGALIILGIWPIIASMGALIAVVMTVLRRPRHTN